MTARRARRPQPSLAPVCPYCGAESELLIDSSPIYQGRNFGPVWICHPCKAWVGTHKNSRRYVPLGRLADADLRKAKSAAHAAFDPLWKAKMTTESVPKYQARAAGYAWLAGQIGIDPADCHIGMFDVEQCRRVVEICGRFAPGRQVS